MTINLHCAIQLEVKTGSEEEIEQKITDMNFVLSALEYQPQILIFTTDIKDEEE